MAWYTRLLSAWREAHDADAPSPFCTDDTRDKLELTLRLADTDAIALFTKAEDGLLSTASVTVSATVAYHDVQTDNPAVSRAAGSLHFEMDAPLADFTVLQNTCPSPSSFSACSSGVQQLLIHKCFDLSQFVKTVHASPLHAGFTRQIVSKGVRGVQLHMNGSPRFTHAGIVVETVSSVMQAFHPDTNCVPENPAFSHACSLQSSTPATVFAHGDTMSTDVPCSGGGFPGTPCIKMFHANAPLRLLLDLHIHPQREYSAPLLGDVHGLSSGGTWTAKPDGSQLLHTSQAAVSGMAIANSAPCYPAPYCASDQVVTHETLMTPGIIALLVICAAGFVSLLLLFLYHRHTARLHTQAIAAQPSLPSVPDAKSVGFVPDASAGFSAASVGSAPGAAQWFV